MPLHVVQALPSKYAPMMEFGRHAGLRHQCRKAWEFESPSGHQTMRSWIMQIGTVSGFKHLSLVGSTPTERTKHAGCP